MLKAMPKSALMDYYAMIPTSFGMHINYTSVGLDINTYLRVCILT